MFNPENFQQAEQLDDKPKVPDKTPTPEKKEKSELEKTLEKLTTLKSKATEEIKKRVEQIDEGSKKKIDRELKNDKKRELLEPLAEDARSIIRREIISKLAPAEKQRLYEAKKSNQAISKIEKFAVLNNIFLECDLFIEKADDKKPPEVLPNVNVEVVAFEYQSP